MSDWSKDVSDKSAAERAKTQLTLGKLINRLKELNPKLLIKGLGEIHSYKSFYRDLSFAETDKQQTVESLIKVCESAIGKSFYNAGKYYTMTENTPLWISPYNYHGERLISINDDGTIETLPYD